MYLTITKEDKKKASLQLDNISTLKQSLRNQFSLNFFRLFVEGAVVSFYNKLSKDLVCISDIDALMSRVLWIANQEVFNDAAIPAELNKIATALQSIITLIDKDTAFRKVDIKAFNNEVVRILGRSTMNRGTKKAITAGTIIYLNNYCVVTSDGPDGLVVRQVDEFGAIKNDIPPITYMGGEQWQVRKISRYALVHETQIIRDDMWSISKNSTIDRDKPVRQITFEGGVCTLLTSLCTVDVISHTPVINYSGHSYIYSKTAVYNNLIYFVMVGNNRISLLVPLRLFTKAGVDLDQRYVDYIFE